MKILNILKNNKKSIIKFLIIVFLIILIILFNRLLKSDRYEIYWHDRQLGWDRIRQIRKNNPDIPIHSSKKAFNKILDEYGKEVVLPRTSIDTSSWQTFNGNYYSFKYPKDLVVKKNDSGDSYLFSGDDSSNYFYFYMPSYKSYDRYDFINTQLPFKIDTKKEDLVFYYITIDSMRAFYFKEHTAYKPGASIIIPKPNGVINISTSDITNPVALGIFQTMEINFKSGSFDDK